MNANELMLGDWVEIGNNSIRVTSLSEGETYQEAKPIPLTKDILVRNGFDCSDEGIARLKTDSVKEPFVLRLFGGHWGFVAFNIMVFPHNVHELQHALKLCGIARDIVL